jgi:hypothetical protein
VPISKGGGGGTGGVTSVFTRTGAVVATAGDYTGVAVGAITNAMVNASAAIVLSKLAATGYLGYVNLQDQKSANTQGGTFTSGSYQTRVLNTEVSDTNGDCSLASNQITLAAGTYECLITAPALFTLAHKARLQNVTDSATVLLGTGEYSDPTSGQAQTRSIVCGRFTIAASKALEVQHRAQQTRSSNGFGNAANFGDTEVYTVAEFWRVS